MNSSQIMKQEKDVLRWGGLSGVLGSLFLIAAMAIVATMLPSDPATWEEWVTRFADIKTTRILENTVYLTGVIFWVPAFLALYYALRRTNLAFALFGSVLGIAMFSSPTFGNVFAGISMLLGIAGIFGAIGNIITLSEIGAIPVFAIIIFNFVMGWKLFSLSRMAGAMTQVEEGVRPELRAG